jgi:hypothetical protein
MNLFMLSSSRYLYALSTSTLVPTHRERASQDAGFEVGHLPSNAHTGPQAQRMPYIIGDSCMQAVKELEEMQQLVDSVKAVRVTKKKNKARHMADENETKAAISRDNAAKVRSWNLPM